MVQGTVYFLPNAKYSSAHQGCSASTSHLDLRLLGCRLRREVSEVMYIN